MLDISKQPKKWLHLMNFWMLLMTCQSLGAGQTLPFLWSLWKKVSTSWMLWQWHLLWWRVNLSSAGTGQFIEMISNVRCEVWGVRCEASQSSRARHHTATEYWLTHCHLKGRHLSWKNPLSGLDKVLTASAVFLSTFKYIWGDILWHTSQVFTLQHMQPETERHPHL